MPFTHDTCSLEEFRILSSVWGTFWFKGVLMAVDIIRSGDE
jgi:hypothetical protein